MSKKKKSGRFLAPIKIKEPHGAFAVPFFVVLFALSVVAFIIPLRPTQSMTEKRNLAEFPEFTVEDLLSGDYFDDISLWFSDTFPGRDNWIDLAQSVENLHGTGDVVIYGDIAVQETIPSAFTGEAETRETRAPTEPTTQETEPPEETGSTEQTEATEETKIIETTVTTEATEEILDDAPEGDVEQWGGVNAGEDADIYLGSVIQVGNTAFNYFGFSEYESNRFITTMNWLAEDMAGREDVNLILTMIPTSVGVMVESEYQEKIGCSDQGAVIDYIYGSMPEDIITVDVFDELVSHNDEYIYFRTDHHWTALGAYYCYQQICETMGMEAAALEEFEEWDQGVFKGSNYYNCKQKSKLELDNLYAYNPPADISMIVTSNDSGRFSWPMLTDMSRSGENSKYMTFLSGDHALCEITNNDLPDAPNCVLVKDSYGNALAPYLTMNYHNVYVVDFREYSKMDIQKFIDEYDIDDVIMLIQTGAAQDSTYNNLIRKICGVK